MNNYLKNAPLFIGLLLIVISGFLPFSTTIYPVDEDPGFASQLHNGFTSLLWFAIFIYSISLIFLGRNVNSPGTKLLFYLILILGGLLLLYVAFISSFSWEGPLHPSLKYGVNIACAGLFIVAVTAILYLPKAQQTRKGTYKSYILPLFGLGLIILSAFIPYQSNGFEIYEVHGRQIKELSIRNGIDHDLFFVYIIFGVLIFIFGYRTSVFSKIFTFILAVLSIPAFMIFNYSYYDDWTHEYGYFIGMLGYLLIIEAALAAIYRMKKEKISTPNEI